MLRFGLVGAGRIARAYVDAFARSNRAQLCAVADVDPAAAARLAAEAACADLPPADLCAAVDAVVVCTPPSTHADLCCAFIEHGLHVLCEKPFALSSAQAHRVVAAAERAGVLVTMASKFRYVEDLAAALRMIRAGAVGEVELIEITFMSEVPMAGRWNARAEVSGGGVLIDNGTHAVDIVRALAGPIASIKGVRGRQIQPLEVEDSAHLFIRCLNGTLASIDLSWSANARSDAYVRVHGSAAEIVLAWKHASLRRHGEGWVRFGGGYDKVQAFRAQIDNFAGAIANGERLSVTPQDACASVAAIEASYETMDLGGWHPIVVPTTSLPAPAA